MKRIAAAGIVLLFIVTFLHFNDRGGDEEVSEEKNVAPLKIPSPPRVPVLGDEMLADYASENSSGKDDLETLARFLDSVFLLVKSRDTSEYSTNEDLVIFLKGANSHQSAFLNDDSPALNDKGQLIDRWGTTIIVHPVSKNLLELRSAGPDRKPYSEDDFLWPKS